MLYCSHTIYFYTFSNTHTHTQDGVGLCNAKFYLLFRLAYLMLTGRKTALTFLTVSRNLECFSFPDWIYMTLADDRTTTLANEWKAKREHIFLKYTIYKSEEKKILCYFVWQLNFYLSIVAHLKRIRMDKHVKLYCGPTQSIASTLTSQVKIF